MTIQTLTQLNNRQEDS